MILISQFSNLLQELHGQCSDIRGTVIATAEGFILAASGELADDAAAAAAVHISQVTEKHLSLLQAVHIRDQLIWTDQAVWYITRLADETPSWSWPSPPAPPACCASSAATSTAPSATS